LKELGQHFLVDEEIAQRIVQAMDLGWQDRALEIGPGRGVLLRFLLKKSRQVLAVEIDRRLQKPLEKTFGGHPGLELRFEDFLHFDLESYVESAPEPVKIVGNLPYSLSAPILMRLFDAAETLQKRDGHRLASATLMLQKEVALRICADVGDKAGSNITVLRALTADARYLFDVPAEAFHPPPKVTSAVLQLLFYAKPRWRLSNRIQFKEMIRHVFLKRRKMLKNTLGGLPWIRPDWREVDFDLSRRPEELTMEDFIRLYNHLKIN
jgi:16S rRNA (adenine1518-N6/adenine1519-N6)-dimethyltransferase